MKKLLSLIATTISLVGLITCSFLLSSYFDVPVKDFLPSILASLVGGIVAFYIAKLQIDVSQHQSKSERLMSNTKDMLLKHVDLLDKLVADLQDISSAYEKIQDDTSNKAPYYTIAENKAWEIRHDVTRHKYMIQRIEDAFANRNDENELTHPRISLQVDSLFSIICSHQASNSKKVLRNTNHLLKDIIHQVSYLKEAINKKHLDQMTDFGLIEII